MKKIESLWKERLQAYINESRRYMKYILNDHLLFVLIFALGGAGFYYTHWLKTVTPSFPVAITFGLIIGVLLTWSPLSTLLKEPDKVFLLPIETKLSRYFRNALLLSFVFQAYILLMAVAILMPLYAAVTGKGFRNFLFFLVIAWILKYANLFMQWFQHAHVGKRGLFIHTLIRLVLNIAVYYSMVKGYAIIYVIGIFILICIQFIIMYRQSIHCTLLWENLIHNEEKRMMRFYRFANLFTDVPKLSGQVKRRRWLDVLYAIVPYQQKNTFHFLYIRTFFRTNEYVGLFIRLTILGVLLLVFIHQIYISIIVSLLFIYLTGFQLIPLYRYHDFKVWVSLYPVPSHLKLRAFLSFLQVLLCFQSIIFVIPVLFSLSLKFSGLLLIINIVFSIVMLKGYIPSRIRKQQYM